MDKEIGARCTTCGLVDFLPITCTACGSVLCKEHIHNHECAAPVPAPVPMGPSQKLSRCALEGCDKPSLDSLSSATSVLCDGCKLAFCAFHREGASHHCDPPKQEPAEPKNAEAHALLDRYFRDIPQKPATSSATPKTPKPPTDPVKLARYEALELMKLRHRAKPADPKETNVAQPDRVHVRVNQVGRPAADAKLLWFKKTMSTGRAVDLCAALYGMNRVGISTPLSLFIVRSDSAIQALARLPNDVPLEAHVFDGTNLILATPDAVTAPSTSASASTAAGEA